MNRTEPRFRGAIFDLDGVITQTAKLHFQAWKTTLNALLEKEQGRDAKPFTHEDDYIPYVDGKPRYQGVRSFLESRGISRRFGDPSDEPGDDSICAIGNAKNKRFRELAKEQDVDVYTSTLELIDRLIERGIAVAVASSSRNCTYILEQTGLKERFGAIVDGNVSRELGLRGKPDPDIFLVAAERIGVTPAEAMMVEDAYAGVEAGRNGNFGLVLGISRSGETERLLHYGADIAVTDMGEITEEEIERWFSEQLPERGWILSYHGFHAEQERLREALTTVGNGYFGTRGSLESEPIDDDIHYPGTYIAGLFNKAGTEIHDRTIYNNDFVNCPNWTRVSVHIDGGERLSPHTCEVVSYRQWLDIRRAVLHRVVTYRDNEGRITRITTRRFASMDSPHLGVLTLSTQPLNHSSGIEIQSMLDGQVRNYGVERYRDLEQRHLETVTAEERSDGSLLQVRTANSNHDIYMRARTRVHGATAERSVETETERVTERFSAHVNENQEITLEKLVGIASGKDMDIADPRDAAEQAVDGLPGADELEEAHAHRWAELWELAEVQIDGDRFAQQVLRLHAYHLLSTAGPHNPGLDVGLPARGLHGEAYRGHIFWDELFIMPFYILRFPEIAKSHLMYRYRRLDAARQPAQDEGFSGAMYPWQSADTGGPESQELHYNPRSGEWDPDLSSLQRHVSISIAYDIYNYFYATNDKEFLHRYGMEMLLEIARFWAGISRYHEVDDRYHIEGVMGPDEFHEKYPDASLEDGGLRDNAYTNVMGAWLLHKIAETYEHLPSEVKERLRAQLNLEDDDPNRWEEIVSKMNVVIDQNGLISQFDGFLDLKELDWEEYRHKYDSVRRMDRILKAEDDSPNRYQVIKQADVLMIFYLLAPEQVAHIMSLMGYEAHDGNELLRINYEYYVKRTSHGSTLSWIVHAAILRYLDEHKTDQWQWFVECLKSDIYDTQGGTTLEGIHCGVMAGSIDIVLTAFAGLNLFRDHIELDPELPDAWKRVCFRIRHQGVLLEIEITLEYGRSIAHVTRLASENGHELTVRSGGREYRLPEDRKTRVTV